MRTGVGDENRTVPSVILLSKKPNLLSLFKQKLDLKLEDIA